MFENLTLDWYWYSQWIALPLLVIAGAFMARLIQTAPENSPGLILAKVASISGTLSVVAALVYGAAYQQLIGDAPETGGFFGGFANTLTESDANAIGVFLAYASMIGAGLTIALGLLVPQSRRFLQESGSGSTAGTMMPDGTAYAGNTESKNRTGSMVGPNLNHYQPTEYSSGPPTMGFAGAATGATVMVPASQRPKLLVKSGNQAGQTYPIDGNLITIGRSRVNTVVLDDLTVSRQHARITMAGDRYMIEDLSSTAGTKVNGTCAKNPRLLSPGDIVKTGEVELSFQAAGPEPEYTNVPTCLESKASLGMAGPDETMLIGQQQASAWLVIQQGAQAGQSFSLNRDTTTIGRSPECTVRLEDQAVSRNHALVQRVDDQYLLCDAGSKTGIKVNGRSVGGGRLHEGSTIYLGDVKIMFSLIEDRGPMASSGGTMLLSKKTCGSVLVCNGPNAGRSFVVGNELVLGREPGPSGATLTDPSVSRRHASIRKTGDGYSLFDLGSSNGTLVDGHVISGHPLKNGDAIEIGTSFLQFGQA